MENNKLGIRKWFSFIVAGLIGQLAWAIENNYLNVFVHDCTDTYFFIPLMTALSAVAATVTTLLMGASMLDHWSSPPNCMLTPYFSWR